MGAQAVTASSGPRADGIAGARHRLVRLWAGLHDRKHREAAGLTLAEGARVALEALYAMELPGNRAPWQVAEILAVDGSSGAADAMAAASRLGVPVRRLSEDAYHRLTALKAPDGVAAVLRVPSGASAGTSLLSELWRHPGARLLAAVGLQNPSNAGALVRVAEAAGATGCVFAGGVDTAHPGFLRGAMGSAFRLPCAGVPEEAFLARWRDPGPVRLLLAEAKSAIGMALADWRPPMALLMGSEGAGAPEAFRAGAAAVSIPMSGGAESLNVAVAAGILLYAARTQWPLPPGG